MARNYLNDVREILGESPQISYLELLRMIHNRGWNIEPLTRDQEALAENIPAWKALLMLSAQSKIAEKKSIVFDQFIESGAFFSKEILLNCDELSWLQSLSQQQMTIDGSPPFCLCDQPATPDDYLHKFLVNVVRRLFESMQLKDFKLDLLLQNNDLVLLMNRCIIRRTYSRTSNNLIIRNRNNQHWHQDSSLQFQSRPMLTIWIPLNNHAGKLVPGIEIADIEVNYFSSLSGDEAIDIASIGKELSISSICTSVPLVSAGGCVVFNGLTFHRTFVNNSMNGFRDSLLLRITPSEHAAFFPGNRNSDITINL